MNRCPTAPVAPRIPTRTGITVGVGDTRIRRFGFGCILTNVQSKPALRIEIRQTVGSAGVAGDDRRSSNGGSYGTDR